MIKIEPIRVLHIVGTMNMGGQETFIMNVYRNIDKTKVQFDFVVHSDEEGYYDNEIKELGGRIYRICQIKKNPIKHMIELYKIIKHNKYKIIHRHTNSSIVVLDLIVAKISKVENIIVHSHSNSAEKNRVLHKILKYLVNLLANKKLACSNEAGKWMYGKKKFEIVPNGIDISKFVFDNIKRDKIRREEKVTNKKIIGHVGRFVPEKNHEFIIKLLYELLKKDSNVELWLIGDGNLRQYMEDKTKELKISKYVKFFGLKNNINEYLQAMDVFIFPSLYEGLGISLIEAQISGLDCLISDKIPNEAVITNNVTKKELNYIEWIEWLLNKNIKTNRNININDQRIKKYDIIDIAKKLEKIYWGDKK